MAIRKKERVKCDKVLGDKRVEITTQVPTKFDFVCDEICDVVERSESHLIECLKCIKGKPI